MLLGLNNFWELSLSFECLDEAMQTWEMSSIAFIFNISQKTSQLCLHTLT